MTFSLKLAFICVYVRERLKTLKTSKLHLERCSEKHRRSIFKALDHPATAKGLAKRSDSSKKSSQFQKNLALNMLRPC